MNIIKEFEKRIKSSKAWRKANPPKRNHIDQSDYSLGYEDGLKEAIRIVYEAINIEEKASKNIKINWNGK